ncbi:secretion protein SctD [Trinickia terrae]|uniref:Secretion protein SctD n=1 Tax=Trinickia terrae TaxID=2571161 RepID=A0A4U1I1E2_9BURK|nr:HrpD5 family protein [Trinickia terrae]TKC86948.1 secretion protein SctD [Trinickia terrae]
MKALRVLTGTHAGAQVQLTSGSYRIGGTEEADICITDWVVDEVTLVIGEDGVTRLLSSNGDQVFVADFVAVPFGDVVFCVGPDDAEWPSDLELLSGLWKTAEPPVENGGAEGAQAEGGPADLAPAEVGPAQSGASRAGAESAISAPPPAPRKMTWRTAAVALTCTAAIGGLATAGALFAGAQSSEAASVKFNADALAKEVDVALHRAGFADLHASPRKDSVVVQGIVSMAGDSARAQQIMNELAPGKARREYDVAQQDVENIQQSLTGTGASVSYSGHGVFRVSGNVQSMQTFRALIAGVRADMDSNARRIDVDVKEAKMPTPDIEYTEVVATGGLRYIETPDGTKHLFASSRDEAGN